MKALTGDAYAEVKALLDTLDPPHVKTGIHKLLGLELLVGAEGTTAMAQQWVCKACKPGFVKDGADFKPSALPKGGGGAAEEAEFPPTGKKGKP